MNILLQVFSCDPQRGGEFAVSWGWIQKLNENLRDGDKIYVITRKGNIEKINQKNLKNVQIISVDYPQILNTIFKESGIMFMLWQYYAYKAAQRTKIKFDVIHVYSLSDFRRAGYWYRFDDSYTIFGPVGGYQMCSKSLEGYDDSQRLRNWVNCYCRRSPIYKAKIKKYKKVYACNPETAEILPGAELLPDVPLNPIFKNLDIRREKNDVTTLLFCGRLIKKKGLLLLIDVISKIPDSYSIQLLIYGDGPLKEELELLIKSKNLKSKVFIKGSADYADMTEIYKNADIFLFPSLRESGGSVLIEAMAHKLPIIGLKKGLGQILSKKHVGLFIEANDIKDVIIENYKSAITELIDNPELRETMGNSGYIYVNREFTWDVMFSKVYGSILGLEGR